MCRVACALLVVEFGRLLLEQRVDIGVAAVDVGAAFDDKRIEAGRGIAERAAAGLDDAWNFLLAYPSKKAARSSGRSLAADADRLEIVDHRLADVGV